MVQRIAQEYDKGRFLLISTTNLDQSRAVIWNIGAIAKSPDPRARDLIIEVLRASASIPGAFPPVMLDVTVAGKRYAEMHVDGGTIAQTFLYPSQIHLKIEHGPFRPRAQRRGLHHPQRPPVPTGRIGQARNSLAIAGKAISTDDGRWRRQRHLSHLSHDQARRRRLQPGLHRRGLHHALQGAVLTGPYLNTLFQYGYQKGKAGYPGPRFRRATQRDQRRCPLFHVALP